MASEVAICNRALQKMGAKRIASLTEDSRNARAMNVAYAPIRDALLREHPWSCAIKRASLAADATAPMFTYARSFTLPSDFLRLMPRDPIYNYNDTDWIIEGKAILTNDSAPLYIRYVYRLTDPNGMDSSFQEAFSARLAVETCEEITQSNTKLQLLENWYKQVIASARRTNAIEQIVPAQPTDDTWITVRA